MKIFPDSKIILNEDEIDKKEGTKVINTEQEKKFIKKYKQEITVSSGTAFKIGFFGSLGALCASILLASILLLMFSSLVTSLINHSQQSDTLNTFTNLTRNKY